MNSLLSSRLSRWCRGPPKQETHVLLEKLLGGQREYRTKGRLACFKQVDMFPQFSQKIHALLVDLQLQEGRECSNEQNQNPCAQLEE